MVALNLGSIGRSSGKNGLSDIDKSTLIVPHKPTHFPQTPCLQSIPQPLPRLTIEKSTPLDENLTVKKDPFARNDGLQHSSIYNTFATTSPPSNHSTKPHSKPQSHKKSENHSRSHSHSHRHHDHIEHKHKRQDSEFSLDRQVVDIVADYVRPSKDYIRRDNANLLDTPLSPTERPIPSRSSSFADQSSPPSPHIPPAILSQEPVLTPKLPSKHLPSMRSGQHNPDPGAVSNVRRNSTAKTARHAETISPGMLEKMEELDELKGLRNDSGPHILNSFDQTFNQSVTSVGSRTKADRMLGIDSNAKIASLYLVSGLGKSTAQWSFSDSDSSRGIQPLEDSMGLFWRPEMLGSSFSGEKADESARTRKDSKSSTFTNGLSKDIRGKYVPDTGPDGAQKLVSKALKFAHPRDVEVVNSTLSPPTTCHAFTFNVPRHDTLAAIARTRLDSAVSGAPNTFSMVSAVDEQGLLDPALHLQAQGNPNIRNTASATELTYYGVTLTVWTHADRDRAVQLKTIKMRAERARLGQGSLSSISPLAGKKGSTAPSEKRGTKRGSLHYMMGKNQSEGDITASETETGMSDSDLEGPLGRRGIKSALVADRLSTVDSVPEDAAAAYDEASDIFWMPYAITMVSRFPIYDFLQDYLRLSWARFSKNAKVHMIQINRLLNYDPPRPGESFRVPVGEKPEDQVIVEGYMPGGLMDFDKGLMKVDFQLWPLFQAVDLDHIITAAEIALSNSGRVIFCSKHPAMLNVGVSTLKYIVEMRGWGGITMPMIHARDTTFVIEDPGPYIIGMPTECRYLLAPPPERVLAALGHSFPMDRSIPMEFKVSYPKGNFRNFNRFTYKGERPHYLGERLKAPSWWRHEVVISAFDKILTDKHKKPTLIQRLMKTGMARPQAQLTVGEQLAKAMMRRRASHYVETRDDLELKVAKINRRLLKLIQEGDHWKKQFEMFEKYADRLTVEANELKTKIERERREAKRLSNIANEQSKQNIELEEKLKNTEDARSEAMRQLSDMHQSIQELEREREDIMNSLEAQINGALAGLPPSPSLNITGSETSSRSATPGDTSSIRSRLSSRSKTTNMTSTRSKPMSVLGQVKGNPRSDENRLNKRASVVTGVTAETGRESRSGMVTPNGSDTMAQRVASIQAKLELALNVVSSQRSASVMTSSTLPTEAETGNETDNEGDLTTTQKIDVRTVPSESVEGGSETDKEANKQTPMGSRRPSNTDNRISSKKEGIPTLPETGDVINPIGSDEFVSADESFPAAKHGEIKNKINPSSPIIMKPESTTRRIKALPKGRNGNGFKTITPPSEIDSDDSNYTAHPGKSHKEKSKWKESNDVATVDGKRLSAMSSTTIAFGQAV
ncbi:uncharacterized protein IL334_001590 [Kwoniella shivajii]|uniref:cDENN domain-containing protein n=1 Tax=Kwoniella shivajii TaxID=564305 RepID=A0ABZ1CVF3_9TREE|nr:hypothetical protein IL334_001590 [Kwoniella shivajii]